jgi:hypothetical protein
MEVTSARSLSFNVKMTGATTSMKPCIPFLLTLLAGLIQACMPVPEKYAELEQRIVEVLDKQTVLIQVDHGELTLMRSQDSRIWIGGYVLFPSELEYLIDPTKEEILINVITNRDSSPKAPLNLMIQLPEQMKVKVETEDASVFAADFQGDLEVDSVSGDITIERVTGTLTLNSNRGNIAVRETAGAVNIVGNYGLLTLQDVSGETAASTIMGNIMVSSLIQRNDSVRLETDHGSVSVRLQEDSALSLQARSTSGEVVCMLPGLYSTARACQGELNSGGGNLSIRTVSGAVTVQWLP